jgi:hypothetical protein
VLESIVPWRAECAAAPKHPYEPATGRAVWILPGDGFAVISGYSLSGFVFTDHLASSINITLPTGTNNSSRGGGPVTRTQKENPRHDVSFSGSDSVEIHPLYSYVSEYSLGSEYEQVVS